MPKKPSDRIVEIALELQKKRGEKFDEAVYLHPATAVVLDSLHEELEALRAWKKDVMKAMRVFCDPLIADKVLRGGIDNLSEMEIWLQNFLNSHE